MPINVNMNMANREVCNLIFVGYKDNKPFLNVDYANVTTTEMTGEATYAHGGWGHPRKIAFFGDRGGTLTIETQITPFKLYSLVTGASVAAGYDKWLKRKVVTAAEGKLTLGNESVTEMSVFALDDDCGTEISGATAAGVFTPGAEGGVTNGNKYVVYYTVALPNAKKLSVTSTTFPGYFKVYGETKDKNEAGEDVLYRMVGYKLAPQTDFSLEFSNTGDPASMTITCDILADADGNMLDMILDEMEAE